MRCFILAVVAMMVIVVIVNTKHSIIKTAKHQYLVQRSDNIVSVDHGKNMESHGKNMKNHDKVMKNYGKVIKNPSWTGSDYNGGLNSTAEYGDCVKSGHGLVVQRDVAGCGGEIDMKCSGGCLEILKVLYSCHVKDIRHSIPDQVKKVKARCESKERCKVPASRKMFGSTECAGSPDKDMLMWLTYRCHGGKDQTKITSSKICRNRGETPGENRVRPGPGEEAVPGTGSGDRSLVEKKVSGCGGRLDLKCDGGHLRIRKVRYSCEGDDSYSIDQLIRVQQYCMAKTECRVPAKREFFGYSRCPEVDFKEMTLTVSYICKGGRDKTKVRARTDLDCPRKTRQTTVTLKKYTPRLNTSQTFSTLTSPQPTTRFIPTTTPTTLSTPILSPTPSPQILSKLPKNRKPESTCPTYPRTMASWEIPLDGGSINITCNPRETGAERPLCVLGIRQCEKGGDLKMITPCITIHQAMAACEEEDSLVPAHLDLVS